MGRVYTRVQFINHRWYVSARKDESGDWYEIEDCREKEAAENLADELEEDHDRRESYIDEAIQDEENADDQED